MDFPDLQPNQYVVVVGPHESHDQMSFSVMRSGLEIRDTLLVLGLDHLHLTALLCRKGSSLSTNESMVKYGTGCLQIDPCRTSVDEGDPNMRPNAKNHDKTENWKSASYGIDATSQDARDDLGYHSSKGRFPSNLLFIHGPECVYRGTKQIGSGPEGGYTYDEEEYDVDGFVEQCRPESPSNYGTEQIGEWECEPRCAVRLINEQSGILKTGTLNRFRPRVGYKTNKNEFQEWGGPSGDSGGAARYFKQLKSRDHLHRYLSRLVDSEECVVWYD